LLSEEADKSFRLDFYSYAAKLNKTKIIAINNLNIQYSATHMQEPKKLPISRTLITNTNIFI